MMIKAFLKGSYYNLRRLKEDLRQSGCHFEFLNDELDEVELDSDEERTLRQYCEDLGISVVYVEEAFL